MVWRKLRTVSHFFLLSFWSIVLFFLSSQKNIRQGRHQILINFLGCSNCGWLCWCNPHLQRKHKHDLYIACTLGKTPFLICQRKRGKKTRKKAWSMRGKQTKEMVFCYQNCSVRKHCSSDREKLWGQEFATFLRSLQQFI